MLKKSRYIALFSIFLLIGCRDNPNKHQNHFKEYDITCRSYETELYGRFPYLLTVDSLLISVAAERSGGRLGRIYSIDDKPQEIGAFGRIGRGPLEFVHPEPTAAAGTRFLIRNLNCREVAMMEIVKMHDSIRVEEIDRMKFKPVRHDGIDWEPAHFALVGNDRIVAVSYGGKGAFFSLYDTKMTPQGTFGDPLIDEEISASERRRCLNGSLAVDGNDFCYVPNDIPRIAYYRMIDGSPQELWRDTFYESYYTVEGKQVRYNQTRTVGITHRVAMGGNYIYILFLDVPIAKANISHTETFAADIVFVYDRKGYKVARLNLNQRIYSMALSTDQKRLYGVVYPDNRLVAFDLPEFD